MKVKFIFVDDLSQAPSENKKVADFEKLKGIGKQWYEHCMVRSNFTVLGGTVMSVSDLDNFTKNEQYNELNAIKESENTE